MKPSRSPRGPLALLITLAAFLLAGCYSETGTLSRAPAAQLMLSGKFEGTAVTVDDGVPLALTAQGTKIAVTPGKHHVTVSRGGQLVLDQVVLVSDLQTLEIAIP